MKRLFAYKPFHFLVFYMMGILFQYYWNGISSSILLFLLIGLLFVLILFRRKPFFVLLLLVFLGLVGVLRMQLTDSRNSENYYKHFLSEKNTVSLQISKNLKPTRNFQKFEASVVQIDSIPTKGNILLNIRKDSTSNFKIGDVFLVQSKLQEIPPPLNPYQFNYKNYLEKQDIYYQVFVDTGEYLVLNDAKTSIVESIHRVRTKIQDNLKLYFKEDVFAVMNALVLGQRQEVSKELIEDYSNAGAIHILAISGLHVGIILLMLTYLLKPLEQLKYGRICKLSFMVLSLWFFAILAGLSASIVRAVTMFTAVAIGMSLQRKHVVEHSLILSMLLMLLVKPTFLFDVGFQMSYLAVFGIVWIQPKLVSFWKPKNKIVSYLWSLITVSVAAQIGVLPLSLFYFHQFPGLFVLSNVVIVPFLGVILFLGIVVSLLSFFDALPNILVVILDFFVNCLNQFVGWVAEQEEFLIAEISMSFLKMIVLYVFLIFACRLLFKFKAQRLIAFLIAVLCFQLVVLAENRAMQHEKQFLVFHQNRASIIGIRKGSQMQIYQSNDTSRYSKSILKNYRIGSRINAMNSNSEIPNVLEFEQEKIILIDQSRTWVKHDLLKSSILILRASPKVNLERILLELQPKLVIADGSNYRSYVRKWQETSLKLDVQFWDTGRKGAYVLKGD